jgi:hypothetical protein
MKLRVEVLILHVERFRRLGKKRGRRPILVRFNSFTEKLEVLQATRNLVGARI